MALQFVDPKTVGLVVNVDINAAGNIATGSDTAAGQKAVTISGFKTAGTGDDAETVFEKLLGDVVGVNYITNTAYKKFNVPLEEV